MLIDFPGVPLLDADTNAPISLTGGEGGGRKENALSSAVLAVIRRAPSYTCPPFSLRDEDGTEAITPRCLKPQCCASVYPEWSGLTWLLQENWTNESWTLQPARRILQVLTTVSGLCNRTLSHVLFIGTRLYLLLVELFSTAVVRCGF